MMWDMFLAIPVKHELKPKINELERMGVIAKVTKPRG
jgi:hypothetical protein